MSVVSVMYCGTSLPQSGAIVAALPIISGKYASGRSGKKNRTAVSETGSRENGTGEGVGFMAGKRKKKKTCGNAISILEVSILKMAKAVGIRD